MPLTTQTAWALLESHTIPKETTMRVTALMKFWVDGQLIQPQQILDLPALVAHEVLTAGKARLAGPDERPITKEIPNGTATETDSSQGPEDVQSVD